jgi:hypothetical protein
MYFVFIIATAGAIATLAAAALTAVLIVKRLSNLRRSTNTDYESTEYADKNSVSNSKVKQEAHKNLDELEEGLHKELDEKGHQTQELDEKGQNVHEELDKKSPQIHEELDPKERGTQGLDKKEPNSHWDVHGKDQDRQTS